MRSTEETRAVAQRVLDSIAKNPEMHRQNHFGRKTECGTTMCIAGWTISNERPDLIDWQYSGSELYMFLDATVTEFRDLEEAAGELLGLDRDGSFELFFEMEDERAIEIVTNIAEGKAYNAVN